MKRSDGFDARRLRSRGPRNWGMRIGFMLGLLLVGAGMLLSLGGLMSILGQGEALGALAARDAASAALVVGALLIVGGIFIWRWCRRRRRRANDLSLSPGLMKKRD